MLGPEVSIILPTHNREHTLPRAITSVLNQTYKDFELIIVDDNSNDNTENIVNNYSDTRVKYYKSCVKLGGSGARNMGISVAKGRYIAFQDSDDVWAPLKLEKQIDLLEKTNNDIGAVYSGFITWDKITRSTCYIPKKGVKRTEGKLLSQLLRGNFIGTPTLVVKRSVINDTGEFDPNLPGSQDWEFVLRISEKYEILFIDEPLVVAYVTEGSILSNKDNKYFALEIILDKHKDLFCGNKKVISAYNYSLGRFYYNKKIFGKANDFFKKSLGCQHNYKAYMYKMISEYRCLLEKILFF